MGLVTNLKWAVQRVTGRREACPHLSAVTDVERRSDGCEQCLATGDSWAALRMCLTCGQVGCCDSSKNRHARRHAAAAGHPIARSAEPGQRWAWCYVDETMVDA